MAIHKLITIGKKCLLCDDMQAQMPVRARAELERQRYQSEILITLLQIAAIAFFSLLYWLAPDAGTRYDLAIAPIPLALGIYAALTLLRLVLAWYGRLKGWMLAVSIVVDFTTLYAIIWSFHITYAQPASMYLKAPEFAFVFILIAMRALRFQPVWVIFAGVTAALGWLAMLGFALWPVGGEAITRDYVQYMTSTDILIGAQVGKLIAITVFTGVLALVLYKANRAMSEAVASDIALHDMSHFFDAGVARRIAFAERELEAGQAEQREAAIMFIDLRNFTRYSSTLSPEALIALLNDYQSMLVPIINKHNGAVDKFLGDGVMVSFGAVEDSNLYARDALNAAHEITIAAREWQEQRKQQGFPELGLGIGIATGSVIFGVIGYDNRLEYTVLGTAVNRAAKLEPLTKQENVAGLCDMTTYNRAREQGYTRELNILSDRDVPGFSETQDLAVLD